MKGAAARLLAGALCLTILPAAAQLPPSSTLSGADRLAFRAEVARVERELASAADKDSLVYQMARTWAAGKQWPEAVEWLRKVANLKAGLDPSRDSIFAELRGTREFAGIMQAVRDATPPVSHSVTAFRISEGDLVPENLARDAKTGAFYVGSTRKGTVVRCTARGKCAPFAEGLGIVLGLKTQGRELWVLSNRDTRSALIQFDARSGARVREYTLGAGHLFNDLAIGRDADVYVTDTRAGAVWRLARGSAGLTRLPGQFDFANGIALSGDGRLLYVSSFGNGISVVDTRTRAMAPIGRPAGLCLGSIDGLYFHKGTLIAIQNGFMNPRIVRLTLTRDLRSIRRFTVLERRNPLFDGITTGVVAGDDFYYVANMQDEKKSGFDPIVVLKLKLAQER